MREPSALPPCVQQQEEEEEPIGDVDLFCLTEERAALQVHPKWLMHLQERQLGEDGQVRLGVAGRARFGEEGASLGRPMHWERSAGPWRGTCE